MFFVIVYSYDCITFAVLPHVVQDKQYRSESIFCRETVSDVLQNLSVCEESLDWVEK